MTAAQQKEADRLFIAKVINRAERRQKGLARLMVDTRPAWMKSTAQS